jgi:glycosyltransferase involved in cell wall biosynthesis
MTDLLTIALPVYKRTDFVRSALESAVKQTVPCRILLIDNNSPHDDFKIILEGYNNPLMTYHRNPETVPQDENFNNCFRYAQTPWVTILHDDDMLHCQFVEMAQKILLQYGTGVGGFSVRSHVGENEWSGIYEMKSSLTDNIKLINESYYFFAQLSPFPGIVVKKDIALKIGGFTNKLFPIADFDFWVRYNQVEKMLMVEDTYAYYRISSTQSTVQAFSDMINRIYEYRKELIARSRYNNFLTRLSLEYSRMLNIEYFKNTYSAFNSDNNIIDYEKLQKATRILRLPLMKKIVWKYIQLLSYSKISKFI